jgi:hypothetical protein
MKKDEQSEPVRAALIAANDTFRSTVHEAVAATGGWVDVGLETDATPATLLKEQTTPLRDYDPQILFLDLGPDVEDGLRLAGVLSRAHPGVGIVVTAGELLPEQEKSPSRWNAFFESSAWAVAQALQPPPGRSSPSSAPKGGLAAQPWQ